MSNKMLGAIVGDIVGSSYERHNVNSTDFDLFPKGSRFTDDTVMTLAVAQWLMEDREHSHGGLIKCMQRLGRRYPAAGYGERFRHWLLTENPQPYNSCGNGAGMRVSPVGLYADTLDEALWLAMISAEISHNHPEGIKGAQAIAACVYLCRTGKSKEEIKAYVESSFGYNLDRHIDDIRPFYTFNTLCQGSVPEAIIAFLEGDSFENVVRLAVSLGGDSDTIACMAGAIAACRYPVPMDIAGKCSDLLNDELRELNKDFIKFTGGRNGVLQRIKKMLFASLH